MCIVTKEAYIADQYGAREFLEGHGFTKWDVEEMADYLTGGELEHQRERYDDLKQEFNCYELALDAAQGVLNDVLNLCAELKERQRSAQGQRALQAVYDLVYKSEAI